MAKFPAALWSADPPGLARKGKDALAKLLQEIIDELIAVQTELGVDPAGASATVDARLDAMDTSIGSNTTHASGDGSDHADVAQNTNDISDLQDLTYYAFANSNSGQSIADATTQIVNFEDVQYDPGSTITIGAAWKFEPEVNGNYIVSSFVQLAADNGYAVGDSVSLSLYLNGSLARRIGRQEVTGTTSATDYDMGVGGTVPIYLLTTDDVDIRIYQNSGGAISVNTDPALCWFSAMRIT